MKFGIIAAGEGSRLALEGVSAPKPLVKVGGDCLLDRLIGIFLKHDAHEIDVICNDLTHLVVTHLIDIKAIGMNGKLVPLKYIVKSTPSSMHSFYELSHLLAGEPFVLTTVDTIFLEDEFAEYLKAFDRALRTDCDGVMGVTDYIDDEKPLYVKTDNSMQITGFYDDNSMDCTYVSGGIYGLKPTAIETLKHCMQRGESRMRNFQRALVNEGKCMTAYNFSKILDIDHAADIAKADRFLTEHAQKNMRE